MVPVRVTSLFAGRLARDIAAFAPTDIVSLIDPNLEHHRRPVFPDRVRVFQRAFWDVDDPGAQTANADVIAELVAFLDDWRDRHHAGADARLLVHCHMGVSRSTASAFVALAHAAGPGREAEAFAALLSVTNKPWPNSLLVRLADDHLGREGRMVAALAAYRAAYPKRLDAYRRLHARRGFY
jgi:predicted protein tyrosine phosphatase